MEGYFDLAIIGFGAFEFIVPKYYYRLWKTEFESSRLLSNRANGCGGFGSQTAADPLWFRAPEKQTVGTVTSSLRALSSSLNAGTAKRGSLGREDAFGCPPAICPQKRRRVHLHTIDPYLRRSRSSTLYQASRVPVSLTHESEIMLSVVGIMATRAVTLQAQSRHVLSTYRIYPRVVLASQGFLLCRRVSDLPTPHPSVLPTSTLRLWKLLPATGFIWAPQTLKRQTESKTSSQGLSALGAQKAQNRVEKSMILTWRGSPCRTSSWSVFLKFPQFCCAESWEFRAEVSAEVFCCSECPSKTSPKTSWKTSPQSSRKTLPRTTPLQNGNFDQKIRSAESLC